MLRAAEDALGPDTPQGQAFAAAAEELNARLGGAIDPAPVSSPEHVEADTLGRHFLPEDGRG